MVYVNKMDITGADFFNVLGMQRERLHCNAVPLPLPIGAEAEFRGIVDLVEMNAVMYYDDLGLDIRVEEIPEALLTQAETYRIEMLEAIADQDDAVMEKVLEGEEVSVEEIKACIRKATIANAMVPVICGTSYRNKGVQKLLDAVVDYMPAPTDVPAIKGINPKTGAEAERHSSDEEPFSALAFKIATDPFVGKLCFFRVYSGKVESGSGVYNASKERSERMGRILEMHSNHRQDVGCVYAGDIAAAIGLKNTTTGDTLCAANAPVLLESMDFPDPVIRVAIEPKTKASQEKMGIALQKLAEEDPTFKTWTDEETGQTIIAGMGELHLEIIVDRMLREFKVEANVGKPQVAYRETVTRMAEVDTRHVRQTGGRGQYAHIKLRLEPNPEKGFEFASEVVGGAVPKEYLPAVEAGVKGAMLSGVLAGDNVVDVKATVYDGSSHEVDSSEMAFKICGSMAFKEAMRKAAPVLMEPIMKVTVTVPEEYMGDVLADLNSRRGAVQHTETRPGTAQIEAQVPLSNMFGYATALRSRTQGRGQYVMEPSHYTQVPKSLAEGIMGSKKLFG
jgi:elongation factor G